MAKQKKPVHRVQMTEGKRNFLNTSVFILSLVDLPFFLEVSASPVKM